MMARTFLLNSWRTACTIDKAQDCYYLLKLYQAMLSTHILC